MQHKRASKIAKHTLANGMQVLVRPSHLIPKVSTQLWYHVGSKDEQSGERGLAHFIEHMIFKGTQALSESDINEITHKLSGTCNAFTAHDYTGYLFDFPTQHWHIALPIMADCMRNCTFKDDLLHAELKAVIQELKMYRDNYPATLVENLVSAIFPDHSYHHPIIGYKQDLWSLQRDALVGFYKKHYIPNNATLVVVGDVEPQEVFEEAEKCFGQIQPDPTYRRQASYYNVDITTQSVVLYRDVQQIVVVLAFVVPGSRQKLDYQLDVVAWILASGKGSRLHQKLVDELELVTEVEAFNYDLFDHGLFFIEFQPRSADTIERITGIIHQEIATIIEHGVTPEEFMRAQRKAEGDFHSLLESNQRQAYLIGKLFLCTEDENYLFKYLEHDAKKVEAEVYDILKNYLRPVVAHVGMLLPLPEAEKKNWQRLQEQSDIEDGRVLSQRVRATTVEEAVVAKTIHPLQPGYFDYPKHTKYLLRNGLQVLQYHNANVPKIEIILEFKAKHYYDPQERQGLNTFMSALLLEGTENYPGTALAKEIETYGISVNASAGYLVMSLLTADLERGLSLLEEIVSRSIFDARAIEKVRYQLLADVKNYWDNPTEFVSDLVRQHVYRGHPYSMSRIGTAQSIQGMSREDLVACYRSFISPHGARIAIVGDLDDYDLQPMLEKTLGKWQGPEVASIAYPALQPVVHSEINYPINRDQVVLCYAGLSVDRASKDYDKLLIFDQIFTGGILGSMSSRLFRLREQTGLFYTVGGSMLASSDEQPGMVYIKTIVSIDRVEEAKRAIKEAIASTVDTITQEEFDEARNAILNSLVDNFETNRQMAATFLALERYNLPSNYFDARAQDFVGISLDDVKQAAAKVLNSDKLVLFKIGRVS